MAGWRVWAPEWQVLLGEGLLVGMGGQGVTCWSGVLLGSWMAGIAGWRVSCWQGAGWRVSGWQGIIFMEGFPSTWWRASLWHHVFGTASGRHGLGTGGLLECRVCAFGWHAGGVLVGSRTAGIAGWRVSGCQGIIFMEGFLSPWWRVSEW